MTAAEAPGLMGYRWPAEWEPHQATWLAWPHNPDTWPGRLDQAIRQYTRFVEILADCEPVHILAGGRDVMQSARHHVGHLANVQLHDIPTNDAWIRDFGPTFLVNDHEGSTALVDWQYNAWGRKYPPFDRDNAVPAHIAKWTGYRRFSAPIVLEGGAIEGNGHGLVLTTETCLMNPNRNPDLGRLEIERILRDFVALNRITWLAAGIQGDDTDGHIDQLVRFVDATTVVVALEEDPEDDNYVALQANFQRLGALARELETTPNLVPLPMPRPRYHQGQRLPASYANFYFANNAVLVPQFDDPADRVASSILRQLCPGREVIGVPASELVLGLGSLHCLTQQQPVSVV